MAKKSSHHRRRRHAGPGGRLDDARLDESGDDAPADGAAMPLPLGAASHDEPDPNDNALADAALRFIDRLRPHFGTILAAAAGVAALLVAWAVVSSQREAGRTQSWEACLSAMASGDVPALEEVIRRHPDTDAARWSDLVVADVACAEGAELLFADRQRAEGRLRAAADRYSAILAARPRGLLAERATFGLAKARESLGQLAEARRGYETVAAEFPGDPLAGVAAARAGELGREATRQWYDWFAAHPPTPPAAASPAPASPGAGPAGGAPTTPSESTPSESKPAAPGTSTPATPAPKASDDAAAPAAAAPAAADGGA
jgi:PAS domain-containing protein